MKREPKKTETLEVRLPPETKSAFMAACRTNGTSASLVLRACIHRYLRSASRAPADWKRELDMKLLATPPRRAAAGAGALGLAAAAAIAAFAMTGPARAADARIAALVDLMDRDEDGRVAPAEFLAPPPEGARASAVELVVETRERTAPDETREALFARLDADGDGALSLAEFEAAVVARTIPTPALAAADADRDGAIVEGELAAFLTAERAAAGIADPSAGTGLLARGIIEEHDRDGDGRILVADLPG
jgi:hypothetical protein